MELDTIFGLPAHPLLVHLPVVAIPVAALVTLAALVLPPWRRWLAPAAFALGVVCLGGTYLVQESGEPLEDRVEDTREETDLLEEHTDMGEQLLPFVAAFVVFVGAGAWAGRRAIAVPLLALAIVGASASTVQVVRIGHSGAAAAWDDVTGGTARVDDDHRGRGRGGDED